VRTVGLISAMASIVFAGFVILPRVFVTTLHVPEQYATIQSAIDAAPRGGAVRIGPGIYAETLEITKALALTGAPDGATRVVAGDAATAVTVRNTRRVRIEGLAVVGGDVGVLIEESEAVQLVANRIVGARFAGIRLSRAQALIKGNDVRAGSGPYGMGIELANTMSRPESLISGNTVAGATHEGIILHNAHATIQGNVVTANGLRGVSISEMSMAKVSNNKIVGNADAGIHVVDHSMAEIAGNQIARVGPGPEGKAHGIRAFYYAEVMLGRDNLIELDLEDAVVASFGATVERR